MLQCFIQSKWHCLQSNSLWCDEIIPSLYNTQYDILRAWWWNIHVNSFLNRIKIMRRSPFNFGKVLVFSLPVPSSVGSWFSPFGAPRDSLGPPAWQRSRSGPAWRRPRILWVQEGYGSECSSQSESWCSWLWVGPFPVPQSTSKVYIDTDANVLMILRSIIYLSPHLCSP